METRTANQAAVKPALLLNLTKVKGNLEIERLPSGFQEMDRVLGGGIVAGALILLAGEPGIGKSTLLSQLALSLSQKQPKLTVFYVCAEESPAQVKMRLERLGAKRSAENFFLLAASETERVLAAVEAAQKGPSLVIVDSVQTMVSRQFSGLAGAVAQTRAVTELWRQFAKKTQTAVFLVGHVTKAGFAAGPKTLEHLVDVVLYFEGDRHQQLRLLRASKNRFGPSDEIGVWRMGAHGLEEVKDPLAIWFRQPRPEAVVGAAASVALEGNRPLPLEVQALVTPSYAPLPKRVINGLDYNRVQIILAILQKQLRLPLFKYDVFINLSGGLQSREPAVDLAVAAALLSSYKNKPLAADSWFLGELSLLGEIRPVAQLTRRIKQAKSLGLKRLISWQTLTNIRQLRL